MIKNNRNISVTSPAGCWTFYQLIGAKVRISSISASSGLFAFDSQSLYTISDIKFRMSRKGKSITSIYIKEIPDKIFTWKDLEIISLGFGFSGYAIAGCFVAGEMWVGMNIKNDEDLIPGDNSSEGQALD